MVIDKFGATKEEIEAIEDEMNYVRSLGYNVPENAIVKFIPNADGLAGKDAIIIHPNTDLEQLRFVVRHEIGHHNEPEREINIWNIKTREEETQESEDFANDFARKTAR